MKRFVAALLCLPLLAFAAGVLEVLPLRHRSADDLLPQLQPFVEAGGTLTGMHDRLFVRASRRNIDELRKLIEALDVPLRRLVVSVRRQGSEAAAAEGGSVDGQVTVAGGKVGASGSLRVYSSSRAGSDRGVQTVQTVDSGRAAIVVGSSLWLPLRQVVVGPGGVIVSERIVQRDLGSGFVALPRVVGDTVTIEISPAHAAPGPQPGSAQVERLSTTVSGPLGQWLVLGGSEQTSDEDGSGQRWSAGAAAKSSRLQLRVEELRD